MLDHGFVRVVDYMGNDEAIVQAKTDSRRFAKRQFTWFSNQHADWLRLGSDSLQENLARMMSRIEETDN